MVHSKGDGTIDCGQPLVVVTYSSVFALFLNIYIGTRIYKFAISKKERKFSLFSEYIWSEYSSEKKKSSMQFINEFKIISATYEFIENGNERCLDRD